MRTNLIELENLLDLMKREAAMKSPDHARRHGRLLEGPSKLLYKDA